jgi:hypothetical protein
MSLRKVVTTTNLRVFGLIWSLIFVVIAFKTKIFLVILIAGFFFCIAIFSPNFFLRIKFYQSWIRFGNVLGAINGFIISFILFYGIFSPVGILLRIFKKDLLFKELNPSSISYFIDRKVQPADMKNQF